MRQLRRIASNLLLLLTLTLPASAALAAANCASDVYHEQARVIKVVDGDTVILDNNKKLRFVGINTPEKAQGKLPAEPYAREATQFLQELVNKDPNWLVRYGSDRFDRYNRLLGHVFLADGTNIQMLMLEQGLAQHIVVPPNIWQKDCYAQAEAQARKLQNGLWKDARYQPLSADKVSKNSRGFYNVEGRVEKVAVRSKRIDLYLSDTLVLRIDKRDRQYFKGVKPESLRSHRVIARGWLFPHGEELHMRLRHKDMLTLID